MSTWLILLLSLTAVTTTYLLSGLIRKQAARLHLIDIPNERSSHTTPVPRGGGIAFTSVFILILPVIHTHFTTADNLFTAIYGAFVLIMLVGVIDDRSHVPVRIRLLIHFAAAFWALYFIYLYPNTSLFDISIMSAFYTFGTAIFLVWLLNLYNFMDGIDSISASETLSIAAGLILIIWNQYPDDPTWLILLLIASGITGFLTWNLPPAKLFMGDTGSASIGILFGILTIHAKQMSDPLFYAWLIMLGVYLVDATITLMRRILSKHTFYRAHRSHAYQHAAVRLKSHGKVSLAVAFINLLWLLPIATAVARNVIEGPVAIIIAYMPLIILALYLKAGVQQET